MLMEKVRIFLLIFANLLQNQVLFFENKLLGKPLHNKHPSLPHGLAYFGYGTGIASGRRLWCHRCKIFQIFLVMINYTFLLYKNKVYNSKVFFFQNNRKLEIETVKNIFNELPENLLDALIISCGLNYWYFVSSNMNTIYKSYPGVADARASRIKKVSPDNCWLRLSVVYE